jgi:DNA-directed RNA polymerase specialized sigma24 family protein
MSNKENKSGNPAREISQVLSRISRHLETLVRLNQQSLRAGRSQSEMIVLLGSMGCGQAEIADLLGTTPNTVNVTLYNAKKKKKK